MPRLKILEILAVNPARHMSAEDVYRRLLESNDDIGLATVYRVLTQFESAGLVTRHHFEGGTAVFELDQGEHHDHIVCEDCGRVEEFADAGIEDRQREIAGRHGFELTDHALTLRGRCVREPSAVVTAETRRGFTSVPPLANAAVIAATCSGVTMTSPCPMATW